MSQNIRILENALKDLEDHVLIHPLSQAHGAKLWNILASNRYILRSLEHLVLTFESLSPPLNDVWLAPGSPEHQTILDTAKQLDVEASLTKCFYENLINSKESRVARALGSLVRQGDARRSTVLLQSTVGKDVEAWDDLIADLEHNGVARDAAADCRSYINQWVQRAQQDGRLSGLTEEDLSPNSSPIRNIHAQSPSRRTAQAPSPVEWKKPLEAPVDAPRAIPTLIVHAVNSEKLEIVGHSIECSSDGESKGSTTNEQNGEHTSTELSPLISSPASPLQVSSTPDPAKEKSPISDRSFDGCESDDDLYSAPQKPRVPPRPRSSIMGNELTSSEHLMARRESASPSLVANLSPHPITHQRSVSLQQPSSETLQEIWPSRPASSHSAAMAVSRPESINTEHLSTPQVLSMQDNPNISSKTSPSSIPKSSPYMAAVLPIRHSHLIPDTTQPLDTGIDVPQPAQQLHPVMPERPSSPDPRSAPIFLSMAIPQDHAPPEESYVELIRPTRPKTRVIPPPVPAKLPQLPARPTIITDNSPPVPLHLTTSSNSEIRRQMEEDPPSPVREEMDLVVNANHIITEWRQHRWNEAYKLLQRQIEAVENGTYSFQNNEPTQPNINFLTHLSGVACSYYGNFYEAHMRFKKVLRSAHLEPPDQVTIAAARWLGDTCIILNESLNAAFAWSVAFHGAVICFGHQHHLTVELAANLSTLNGYANSTSVIKSYLVQHGRDITTIFEIASPQWKLNILHNTQEHLAKPTNVKRDLSQPANTHLDERLLTRPLTHYHSLPFASDPTFCATSSICLLATLSRPKSNIALDQIRSSSLTSPSTQLFFRTKRGAQWLVNAVRECLNSYSIEFKVTATTVVVRLSQRHMRIAFYQCFGIQFRKVPMRNVYGVKLSNALYTTREFSKRGSPVLLPAPGMHVEEMPTVETVRAELMERIRSYLEEKDLTGSVGGPGAVPDYGSGDAFELAGDSRLPAELAGSMRLPAELEDRSVINLRKKKKGPSLPEGVVELPA